MSSQRLPSTQSLNQKGKNEQLSKTSAGNRRGSQSAQQTSPHQRSRPSLEPIQEETIRSISSLKARATLDSKQNLSSESKRKSNASQEKPSNSSLLEKPFIFRNAESLQRAIDEDEKRILNSYLAEKEREEQRIVSHVSVGSKTSFTTRTSDTSDNKSQTESAISSENRRLEYLMGLGMDGAEEELTEMRQPLESEMGKQFIDESIEESITGTTEAMRQAQRYLRIHKIFEFFQFLIAHLLSALPENPINYLLEMLDKCIIYRAGMGQAPVLYERKHIEALFNLMDRMRTGYVSKEQYITGMKTLGVCSYVPNPPMSRDGMIHKNFFIEEAYENLVSMTNDLIRRRWIHVSNVHIPITTPPPTPQYSAYSGRTKSSKKQ